MKFEWDPKKERLNIQKHNVTFEEAAYVFSDKYSLSMFDEEHSQEEERWILLGKSLSAMILVVVHTFRGSDGVETVRIISARKATKNEQQIYHKKVSVMKKEYDFANAQQGKFYRPLNKLDIPIYLDEDVKSFFVEKMKKTKDFSLNTIINSLLKQDIEISKKLA